MLREDRRMTWRLRVFAAILVSALAFAPNLAGAEITLAWDRNPESDIRGYRIYYGPVSRSVSGYARVVEAGNVIEFTLRDLPPGPYFFAVTAVNMAGLESGYSNEVSTCDVNRDGLVNRLDLEILEQVSLGTAACPSNCDVNLDGTVDASDIRTLQTVLGTSTTTPSDSTPPIISGVSASNVTATSATISWTTNEAADSLVEYGTTTSYGSSAGNGSMVLAHAQILSGLTPETLYHYRVRSKDAAGNVAISSGFTFTTSAAGPSAMRLTLRCPRPALQPAGGAASPGAVHTGFALAGLADTSAYVIFTAFDGSGKRLDGPGITNPGYRTLTPRAQVAVLDHELFCSGSCDLGRVAYVTIESTTERLAGFYMVYDSNLAVLDGADISRTELDTFVLPEVSEAGFCRIDIVNPTREQAQITFELRNSEGIFKRAAMRLLGADAALSLDPAVDLFAGMTVEPGDYLRITSTRGVLASQTFGRLGTYVSVLHGQDVASAAMTLYSPQYVVGDEYRSSLSVVNLENVPDTVSFRLFSESGEQVGPTRELEIAPLGKLYITEQDFFGSYPGGIQGYVEIASRRVKLAGSVVFGDTGRSRFSTALPLVGELRTSQIFSHVASGPLWFMGIAIVNPGDAAATVTIDLYKKDGTCAGTKSVELPPRGRQSKLLTDYFPELNESGQEGGYVRLFSNQGVAAFALFGTRDLNVLSAIPAQPVP